ncbi:MAG: hypothetical protein JWL77_2773 [Chthonomonadaceae bacterium]|nr:hypothetical protein [Chthonomonadaceae bacterium]
MRPMLGLLLLLFGLLLTFPSRLAAQSITVTPAAPYVVVNKTVQFAAQVTGLSSSNVTWWSGGVKGGNATAGTISAAGLYTAPAKLPGQNPVQIKAVSTVNTAVTATIYVNILAPGPTITAVTPNPLAVGTVTVTITGSGLKQYATAYISYGTNSMIQMSTTGTVTATTLTATGYLGNATTATFCVKNPGSDYSNSLTIPVSGSSDNPGGGGGTTTHVLTVVNGSGSGTYAPGTVVTITANAPPAGQSFAMWTGATVANATASSTTLTMPSTDATVTATYTGPPPPPVTIPFPVSSHPRLWVTQNDLPRLQSWATANNPIYQQGIVPLLQQAVSIYNTQFFPNGVANPNYPDPGDTQGYSGYLTEQYGIVLAFNSLIDPSPTARVQYAQYARNMLMVAMNQAALGHLSGAPFRDPLFAVYNRANGSGEQWPLIVDWLYNAQDAQGNPILTAADRATIRKVFMLWANDCLNASTTGGDHPAPIGVTNSLQLLPNNKPYRMAANNYYLGHARLLTMMALSIDPNDDPSVNSALPASQLGNTLRSYLLDANGAWLYQEFAMFGDPAVVANAYGISGNGAGFGLASGGLPAEGMLYGHSIGFVLGQLLALQTAGFHNPAYAGPQIQLIDAPVWDRFSTGFLTSLTPAPYTDPTQPWLGPVYQFGSYGDLLRLWVTPDFIQPFALLSLLNAENGKTTNRDAARWMAVNALEGGPNALLNRITQPYSYSSSDAILYYLLLDPTLPAAADPRPNFPTTFYDPGAGRIVAHSDWSATGTMFDYRASWISINHQDGDGGQFELYRKGEWLTKEMSNYDNNAVGLTTTYHNTLALQNWCANGTPNLQWYEAGEWANGSQWMLGLNAGDPTTVTSSGPGYLYASSDLTNLYNRPNFWTPSSGATDISQATRSIVWLNNDTIVVYDRASSIHTGLFKRFNLSLINNPTISGNLAVETLASGQQLFVQTLLPATPSVTATYAAGNLNPIAWMEPTRYILTVEDPTNPSAVRFLHVLQGADAGAGMAAASRLQSTQGTVFDGAVFGSSAVFFPVSTGASIAATSFVVPTGVHTVLITGLAANASVGAAIQINPNGTQIDLTPGGTGSSTDAAGVLRLTF